MNDASQTAERAESEGIARQMAAWRISPEVQEAQTLFRLRLARTWSIDPGTRILEIGCGQGNTTAVLAHLLGDSGRILATDVAVGDYGAPLTLSDSAAHLSEGSLGTRIEFRFEFDPLDERHDFAENAFDLVVMAHCSWYFPSAEILSRTLARVRHWSRRLAISEWDLVPRRAAQNAHMVAATIQGTLAALGTESLANIRTPLSRRMLRALLEESGWRPIREETLDSSELADAQWEIALARSGHAEQNVRRLPPDVATLLDSQIDVLNALAAEPVCSLDSYSILAG